MVRQQKGVRTFICKRCDKKSTDQWGGFKRYDSKHDIELEYENVDLCQKCFKKTRKEQMQFNMLKVLFDKKILKEDNVKQFQSDKQFRNLLVKKHFTAKKGELKAKNKKYIEDLKRSQKVDRDFGVLFN